MTFKAGQSVGDADTRPIIKKHRGQSGRHEVVDVRGSGGANPYTWWAKDQKVKPDQALAIWR